MPEALQTGASRAPLSFPSKSGFVAPSPRRDAARGILQSLWFVDSLRRALNLPADMPCREINVRLAAALCVRDGELGTELDGALLKRALGRTDATDENILSLVVDVATQAGAAENRALLCEGSAEAAKHWAAADECRRRAGIPESCWRNNPRRTRL